MSKICIIVPVYNREATIRRCVKSIINQTFSDWTLLLVDDGSRDSSVKICDDFAAADERIRVIHKENGGVSSARNAGLDWAFENDSSPWLAFIDSDDWISPAYFQRLLEAAEEHGTDISCCNYVELTEETTLPAEPKNTEILTTEAYWKNYASPSVVPWGKIYQKTLFANVRYPLGKICDDTFTTHKILFQRDMVAWTPEQLYCYYISSDGISRERNAKLWSHWSEAYEEQSAFFHEKNLTKIRDIALRRMLHCKASAVACAKNKSDTPMEKELKNDLRRQMAWAQRDLGIRLSGNEYIYETIMPRRAALSRKWRHFRRNMRKLLTGR